MRRSRSASVVKTARVIRTTGIKDGDLVNFYRPKGKGKIEEIGVISFESRAPSKISRLHPLSSSSFFLLFNHSYIGPFASTWLLSEFISPPHSRAFATHSCASDAIGITFTDAMANESDRSWREQYHWFVCSCLGTCRFRWLFGTEETSTTLSLLSSRQLNPFFNCTITVRAHARDALSLNSSAHNFILLLDFIDG